VGRYSWKYLVVTWEEDTEMELRGVECEGGDYTELAEAMWSAGGFCGNVDTMKMKNFLINKIHRQLLKEYLMAWTLLV
jgi:hypothetical protein